MNRVEIHKNICEQMNKTYKAKNKDYGNSFVLTREKYPNAILIRLNDKLTRLETLMTNQEQMVKDESIDDTLLDLANYAIMELIERQIPQEQSKREARDLELKLNSYDSQYEYP